MKLYALIIRNQDKRPDAPLDMTGVAEAGLDPKLLAPYVQFLLPIWEAAVRLNMTWVLEPYFEVELGTVVERLQAGDDDGTREYRMAAMMGGLVGDALGAPYEFDTFKPNAAVPEKLPMRAGGVFRLPAGQWTDDGAQSLCFYAALLLAKIKAGPGARFPAALAKDLLVMWRQRSDPIMTGQDGRSVGLGGTVAPALDMQELSQPYILIDRFQTAEKIAQLGEAWAYTGTYYREPIGGYPADGNGSQMRLAPMVAMAGSIVEAMDNAYLSSMTTTGGHAAADLSRWHAFLMYRSFEINKGLSAGMTRQQRFVHVKEQLFGRGHETAVTNFIGYVGQSTITPPKRPGELIVRMMTRNREFAGLMKEAAGILRVRHGQQPMPDGTPLFPRHPDDAAKSGAEVCPDAVWKPNEVDPVALRVIQGQGGMANDQSFEWRTMPLQVNERTATRHSGNKRKPGGYYGSYAGLATTMVMHCILHAKTPDDAVKMCIAKGGDCDSTGAMIQMIVGSMCGLKGLSEEARAWHSAVNHPVNACLGDNQTRPWDLFAMGIGPVDLVLMKSTEPSLGWVLGKYALWTLVGAGALAAIAVTSPASLPLLAAFGAYAWVAALVGGGIAGLGAGMFLTGSKELVDGQVSHPIRTTLKTVCGALLALPLLWVAGVVQGLTAIMGAVVAAGAVLATTIVGVTAKSREATQASAKANPPIASGPVAGHPIGRPADPSKAAAAEPAGAPGPGGDRPKHGSEPSSGAGSDGPST